ACINFWQGQDVVSPSACPYQVGAHPRVKSALNNAAIPELLRGTLDSLEDPPLMNLMDTFYNRFINAFNSSPFPSFLWQDYLGPQPLSGILQGLALIHDLFRTKFRVPGDKFGLMTLINTPGYTRTFIPPTTPIFKNPNNLVFSHELQDDQAIPTNSSISSSRLESFLSATHPSQIRGLDYWSFERVAQRYQLGLFPPIQETGETNLVWTLAVVAAYLREHAVNNQVIVPVFTDLIAFGDCQMGQITGGKIKWENIYNCIRNPIRGLSGLASPTPADYNQLVNRLMYNLTGNRDYVGGQARSHQGLIRFMAENNIFPIFFVFNATAGGIPIIRHGNECLFSRKELRQRNFPTAFNRNFDLAYGLDIGRSIWLARRSGNYGNIYAYTFGDLEPIFREVGSDFVQILPRCKPSFNESLSSTNLLTSIIARIQFLCNWYNSRNLSLNTQMAATHYSRGDNTFGPCGHSRCKPGTSTNFACHGWFFVESDMHKALSCLAFDSRAAFNSPVRYGASLFNLGLDLNMPINQTLRSVNIRPDRRVEEDFTRNFSEWNFVGRFDDFNLTFMPHIDISVAGGLRCHPTMNIEQQIEEVLRDILKKPIISLVNNFEEVGQ
ncbi:MAG: hypothetical protein NZO16_06760, partial [Deltaproteobacteria bacterium]|nr:hypothetical protein [Deltaproteobacteria bacterium]